MEKLGILLFLIFLCVCCAGFYYLCNSAAVENSVERLTDGMVNLINQVATGLFYLFIGVAIAVVAVGLGFGAKAGAEAVGKQAVLLMAAPAVKKAIENKQTARLPGGFTVESPMNTPYMIEDPRSRYFLENPNTD